MKNKILELESYLSCYEKEKKELKNKNSELINDK